MRLSLLLVVMLAAPTLTKRLDTIEDGEAFAESRGIMLSAKLENTRQAIAPRSYDYKVGDVELGITQFATGRAAKTWCEVATSTPGFGDIVCNGLVAFQMVGGEDVDRRRMVSALKGKTRYQMPAATTLADAGVDVGVDADAGVDAGSGEARTSEPAVADHSAQPPRNRVGVLPPDMRGYQGIAWGAREGEVKRLHSDIKVAEDGRLYRECVAADFLAICVYSFKNGKLKRVMLQFDSKKAPRGLSQREVVDALQKALETKYGPAKVAEPDWLRKATWENDESTVRLLEEFMSGPFIIYESKRLIAEVEQVPTDGL
ncbi:hypothetical protein [Myxococcus landrumensis]|uniref:Lipoprotein n=1 Tax=Myxococcus landrumensis TaxID=2813577 RepID=A0ABX7NFJ4_9BACT|nr:hypothetical protein [Myxococcus landrumus]QSQ17241.1 hypothetical protein JY572_14770 [Myxococcus landrumus]